jgi:hypothetical protein
VKLFKILLCSLLLNAFVSTNTLLAQDAIAVDQIVLEGGSPSVASRVQTAQITQINFTEHGIVIDFTKRDGLVRWPDVVPPGWDGPIQYTVWIGMQLQGQWHMCSVLEFWYGRGQNADSDAGGNATRESQIQRNWTYFCGPMARQPQSGEPVAFMVSSGDQRRMDVTAVRERSNVVVIPFPADAPAVYPIAGIPTPTPTPTPVPVPSPLPIPAPVPAPAVDLAPVLLELHALELRIINVSDRVEVVNQQVQDGRNENKAFFAKVGSEWKRILTYAGPIVGAIFLGRGTAPKQP